MRYALVGFRTGGAMRAFTRRAFVGTAGLLALSGCAQTPTEGGAGAASERPVIYDPSAPDAAEATGESAGDDVGILMVGDILVHPSVWQSGVQDDGTRNYDHLFVHVADDVAAASIAMLDQETLLGGESLGFSGYPIFNSPQEFADAEVAAGFDVVLHANNHVLDYGMTGIESELAYWRANYPDVVVTGMADSEETAASVPIVEREGHRIALLNYTADTNGIPLPDGAPWAVRMLTEDQVTSDFAAAKEAGAEAFVVCPHWGTEYAAGPNDDQIAWAQRFADLGATIIIGNHPHVMQPYTLTDAADGRRVPTFWSTGNFVSGQDRMASMIGGMVQATLRFEAGEVSVAAATITPLVVHKAGAVYGLSTYKLAEYTEEQAADNGIRNSSGCSEFSRQWCVDFCADRLGDGFNVESCVFTGEI